MTTSFSDTEAATVRVRIAGEAANPGGQERLLPLMVGMVVVLTLFFFVASFVQLGYLHRRIEHGPPLDLPAILKDSTVAWQQKLAPEFKALAVLESNALERRYHQANVLLMSRVWTRYLGFVTGMILALVGAVFILGKLREEASELRARGIGGALSLRSTSPGLVLATLGVGLMAITLVTHQEIATSDAPVYLRPIDPKPVSRPGANPSGDATEDTTTIAYNW
jgi:hypothetical protein